MNKIKASLTEITLSEKDIYNLNALARCLIEDPTMINIARYLRAKVQEDACEMTREGLSLDVKSGYFVIHALRDHVSHLAVLELMDWLNAQLILSLIEDVPPVILEFVVTPTAKLDAIALWKASYQRRGRPNKVIPVMLTEGYFSVLRNWRDHVSTFKKDHPDLVEYVPYTYDTSAVDTACAITIAGQEILLSAEAVVTLVYIRCNEDVESKDPDAYRDMIARLPSALQVPSTIRVVGERVRNLYRKLGVSWTGVWDDDVALAGDLFVDEEAIYPHSHPTQCAESE